MSNSALIAAMGSVAAAIFFLGGILGGYLIRGDTGLAIRIAGFVLSAVYLFVSLFWGVRATSLESFQVKKKE